LSPTSVTLELPVWAAFPETNVTLGASNVRMACAVPTRPLTVTVTACQPFVTETAGNEQSSTVAVVHATLRHTCRTASEAVAVESKEAKFKPEIVADA
jgi:hypothetical protein